VEHKNIDKTTSYWDRAIGERICFKSRVERNHFGERSVAVRIILKWIVGEDTDIMDASKGRVL
jgi:hypothetical protein